MLVVVALLTSLALSDGPPDPAGTVDGAVGAVAAARARYLEGDFAAALAAADAADAAFRAGPAFSDDAGAWSAWADARITRGLALRRLGRDDEADDTFRALIAVRRSYVPDKDFVPPKVVARFEDLRGEVLGAPTVPLTLQTAGATAVILDGRPVAGGTIDLPPGTHFVGAAGAQPPRGEVVVLDAPRTVRLGPASAGAPADGPRLPAAEGDVDDDGPSWVWAGVAAGAAAAVVGAVVVAAVVLADDGRAANPGGVNVDVDTSRLDAP